MLSFNGKEGLDAASVQSDVKGQYGPEGADWPLDERQSGLKILVVFSPPVWRTGR